MAWDIPNDSMVRDLQPIRLPGTTPAGSWPCSLCAGDYEVHRGWVLTLRHLDRGGDDQCVVCPDCARRLIARWH